MAHALEGDPARTEAVLLEYDLTGARPTTTVEARVP
jgi:hypothetical protein